MELETQNQPPEPIQFEFDERKATAAAAYLIELHGGQMNDMRLIKLLYLADRQSLKNFGRPIAGDRYYSMDQGPVLSTVYDLLKANKSSGTWGSTIERDSRCVVRLKAKADLLPLSDAEFDLLRQAADLYRFHDQWALRDLTHDFPEWEDPHGTSMPIPVERILLEGLGKTPAEIETIRQNAKEKAHFERIFGH